MSNLLPVAAQTLRPRADVAPERRGADTPTENFADSLATARADDGQSVADGAALAKARLAAQQRADLRALMLSGAMKFAVTRHDAPPEAAVLPGLVASLPAKPEADGRTDAVADDTMVAMSPIAIPDDVEAAMPVLRSDLAPLAIPGDAVAEMPVLRSDLAPMAPPDETVVRAMPDDVVVESLPEFVTDAHPVIDQAAATAAAMQLVATLPLMPPAMSIPDLPDDASSERESVGDDVPTARLDRYIMSLPDRPSADEQTTLVEDHFDAPGILLHDAPRASGLTRVPEASTEAPAPAKAIAAINSTTTAGSASAARATELGDRGTTDVGVADLDPAFRERLDRVMERMQREFGHEVTVVETVRSQARQDTLYAQGRTAPGPVVTWTRTSKHAQGRAADLMVDGAWENPLGYAHLAEIAKQEGLRTLGARDPGHVELPGEQGVSGETLDALLKDLQGNESDQTQQYRANVGERAHDEAHASTMARVANVAQVARVATVASVAQVAKVARPGESARDAGQASDATSPLAVSGVVPMAGATDLAGSVRVTAPVSSMSMADRISHLMDLQATQAARPLSSVMLRMENAGGMEDQIRIDTRGSSVDARLGLGNAQQAAALTERLGELREALERRGLTADGVRVQSTAAIRTTDSATFSRSTAPIVELAAMRAASDSQAQSNLRDQSTRDQQQREAFARDSSRHTPRSSSDDTRQRSRREQPEDRR